MNEIEYSRAVAMKCMEQNKQRDIEEYKVIEQRGFKNKFFPRQRDGRQEARWDRYVGRVFKVVARVTPMNGFPMWIIEFEDGFRMAANRWEVLR